MNSIIAPLLRIPRYSKGLIVLFGDILACVLAVWLAFYLRLGQVTDFSHGFQKAVLASVLIAPPVILATGLHRVILRHATWSMVAAMVRAIAIYGAIYALIFTVVGIDGVPRTIGLIQPIVFFLGMGSSRAIVGYWIEMFMRGQSNEEKAINILIYGAGAAGKQLAAAIGYGGSFRMRGFVDDAPELEGRKLGSKWIIGPAELPAAITRLSIDEVFLAIPSASRARRKQLMKMLHDLDVRVRTLPGLMDLASGKVEVSDLRPLEIEDLLGREVVAPDQSLLCSDIAGKTVLVTGAGGSIGSELSRQILRCDPQVLLLVESSEYALYAIHQELEQLNREGHVEIVPLMASVQNRRHLDRIMGTWNIDTLYHAAAYKHVPLVEHNPIEGAANNVMGTLNVAECAIDHQIAKFVLISTDKAVRPTNIMGASKRVAELILQAMANCNDRPKFTMVRFGNVLGSSGSVVPLFREQIKVGGPITITHKDINRFFMTIPEAAQLVIQAGALAEGGDVFVLDMGEPVRIIDLARNMIELSGLSVRDAKHPEGDIEICEIGLRPGEKLYEELLIGNSPEPTVHPRILKANEPFFPIAVLKQKIDEMKGALESYDVELLRKILLDLVVEYQPEEEVVDFVTRRRRG